eukprot:TRINITY_DN2271_c0_g1_i4.p2 TRINITY_DN2271_c0_g1~~TRINITY_DN2271_c0_g1_i4.p2  ORF type:complete len:102 (-),score=18.47 TRINITY_DN2271_c0_g1_i4:432-737(-)
MLSIGALYLGAQKVVGFDIDPESLSQFTLNYDEIVNDEDSPHNYELVLTDMKYHRFPEETKEKYFDIVLMNPPFGAQKKGDEHTHIDMIFLEKALQVNRPS